MSPLRAPAPKPSSFTLPLEDRPWGKGRARIRSTMSSIEESKELSFGIASMDREHLGQLSLLNDLKAAVRNGADDSLVYALLNELVDHTNLHFLSEALRSWLVVHIQTADKTLAEYLSTRAAKPAGEEP